MSLPPQPPLADAVTPDGERRAPKERDRRARWGKYLLGVGLVLLLVLAFAPSPYVIRQPGPAFDALGTTPIETEEGERVERSVIEVDGTSVYDPETGSMAVMTVNITGTPEYQPTWFEVATAWVSPDKDVLPIEAYYPDGVTTEQRNEETSAMMAQSQGTAIAAALTELGHEVTTSVVINEVKSDGAVAGILEPGDVIVSVEGEPVSTFEDLNAHLTEERPLDIVVERDGVEISETVTPRQGPGDEKPLLGVIILESFDFPIEVDIELGEVGGPSAGLIFTLALIDVLEEGELTGGDNIAGTGTMAVDGEVGSIGGIRQKVYAAVDIGADYFLAPEANCAEALSAGVADELPIYAISTLDEALQAVETEAENAPTDSLRTCADAVAAGAPQL